MLTKFNDSKVVVLRQRSAPSEKEQAIIRIDDLLIQNEYLARQMKKWKGVAIGKKQELMDGMIMDEEIDGFQHEIELAEKEVNEFNKYITKNCNEIERLKDGLVVRDLSDRYEPPVKLVVKNRNFSSM